MSTKEDKVDAVDSKVSTQAGASVSSAAADTEAGANAQQTVSGRAVFVVETVPVGVSVRTGFLTEDGRVLDIPAVFPNVHYALAQLDELRQLLMQRFDQAAQIGAQVLAAQVAQQATQVATTEAASTKDRPATLNS